jgi:hypothetical protein
VHMAPLLSFSSTSFPFFRLCTRRCRVHNLHVAKIKLPNMRGSRKFACVSFGSSLR